MRLEVRLAGLSPRHWHLVLLEGLAALPGVEVVLEPAIVESPGMGPGLERVFALERILTRRPTGLSNPIEPASLVGRYSRRGSDPVDLVIDLTAEPLADSGVWWLEFDGRPGEDAALMALRRGRVPLVTLRGSATDPVAAARPGSESPGVLVAAFEDLLAGCLSLIVGAIRGAPFASPSAEPADMSSAVASLWRHSARQLTGALAHRGYRTLYRAPHWRVGWRFVDGPGLLEDGARAEPRWQDLPDDGYHFYADPFPFVHGDRTFLFVEDFDHRRGRGVISVVEFDDRGPRHVPLPVLEHDVHLSYPFVLENGGEVFLIPETSEARRVELYRAVEFPHRWTRVATLVDGVEASDATVFTHEGRWWMMATVRTGGSFSDALHLWSADALDGPWRPHDHNPVLIDIAAARPAGRVLADGGRLLRPVQDGRTGYGTALAVAEVTRLDEQHFEQQVVRRLAPGAWWPGRRLHTLNRAGRLECIDGSAMSPRLWRPRRGGTAR